MTEGSAPVPRYTPGNSSMGVSMRRIALWALALSVGALIVANLSDVQRYLKMRRM